MISVQKKQPLPYADAKLRVASSRIDPSQFSMFFNENEQLEFLRGFNKIKDIEDGAYFVSEILSSDRGGKVCFVTDYDSDGCHSAAIAERSMVEMGFGDRFLIMVPDREKDGYGVNPAIVERAKTLGASVIITADNGISAFAAANKAKEIGVPFIVTDHHLPSDDGLPCATYIVNPARKDCQWGGGVCCGAAVLFFFMRQVRESLKKDFSIDVSFDAKRMLQLVGAATVADCVPLIGVNRYLVKHGLEALRRNPYPGYLAFLRLFAGELCDVDESTIGFKVAPAINSAGRLGSSAPSVSFLSTEDDKEAGSLARFLKEENEKRKEVQSFIFIQAERVAEELIKSKDSPVLVLGDPSWHHGVVGIVAARLSDKYLRPVILFGSSRSDGSILKGSARAGKSKLNLKKLLDKVNENSPGALLGYGGHHAAAGCSIQSDSLDQFSASVTDAFYALSGERSSILLVDSIVDWSSLSPSKRSSSHLLNAIFDCVRELSPFGAGFSPLSICLRNIPRSAWGRLGPSGSHMKAKEGSLSLLCFNHTEEDIDRLYSSGEVSCIATPGIQSYKGRTSFQMTVDYIDQIEELQ